MGGRGSGSGRGSGKAGGLDKNLINRANAASVTDMGDIINRTYHRNIEEIGNLQLSSEEKAKAIHVVPTLCWSNEQSYEWCFDGEPQHSIVAISSVGTQQSKQNQALFEKGVRAALARLEPSEILWYGKCPEEFDWNVMRIQPYYKQVKRRCKNGL